MLSLKSIRPGKGDAVARFAEVSDRTDAEKLRGTVLAVARESLPPLGEGEYYHADLIDLPCTSPTGEDLGHVVAVDNYGAGDVIELKRPDGGRLLVSMNRGGGPREEERAVG